MIEIRDLTVRLNQREILKNIDLDINGGTWTCLVGPNGAGKTTLLKVLLGLLDYSGNVRQNNKEVYKDLDRQVAYVPQNPQVPSGMNVYEYISLGRMKRDGFGVEKKSSRDLILNTLEEIGLLGLHRQSLTQISGGELQRAHLARVIVQEADLILLDEPTSALDLHHQISVLSKVEDLKSKGTTIISTMHDLTLASMYSDEIAVLKEGKLLTSGPANQLINSAELKSAYNNQINVFRLDSGEQVILPQKDI
jgi:iron complex transport system ATP-binding protein